MTEQAVEKAVRFANKHRHADFITPTFNAITNTMNDITQDETEKIMIVPEWPAQSWWPKIMKEGVDREMIGTSHMIYKGGEEAYRDKMPKYNMWVVRVNGKRWR